MSAQPPAIVVGVVIPDPDAIHEYPMTMMEAIEVVVVGVAALSKVTMIEPGAVTVVMPAVAIEGLGISVTEIAPGPGVIELAASGPGRAFSESASATRAGAEIRTAVASRKAAATAGATSGEGRTATTAASAHAVAATATAAGAHAVAATATAATATAATMSDEDERAVMDGTYSVL